MKSRGLVSENKKSLKDLKKQLKNAHGNEPDEPVFKNIRKNFNLNYIELCVEPATNEILKKIMDEF